MTAPPTATFWRVLFSHTALQSLKMMLIWMFQCTSSEGKIRKEIVDVRNRNSPLSSVYNKHEQKKRWLYDQRVREVELATFISLVLSTACGMGRAATTFYKRLASVTEEHSSSDPIQGFCRTSCLSYLRASIMAIRRARSSCHHPATECPIDLQVAEGHFD